MNGPTIDASTLLSTLAQVSCTLAALIGFLGLWKLDGLEREDGRVEHELRQLMARHRQVGDYGLYTLPRHTILQFAKDVLAGDSYPDFPDDTRFEPVLIAARPRLKSRVDRIEPTLPADQQWLKRGLMAFLVLAIAILVGAFLALSYAPMFRHRAWVPRASILASLLLAEGTVYMVLEAAGRLRTPRRRASILMGMIGAVLAAWVLTELGG